MADQTLSIRVKRVDPTLPLPRHETPGSVGFDLLCRESITVAPGSIGLVPANVILAVPEGYMLLLASRSSLPRKKGLMIPNGVGIIDQDYCGPEDEIHIQVYNFTGAPVHIERGERLAQGIFVRISQVEWEEVEEVEAKNRGGFGSTG